MFERYDISPVTRLRPTPLRNTRFIADVHLGSLARSLRLLGFDTTWERDLADEAIIEIAGDERRIILTRDKGILKNGRVTHGYWLRSTDPMQQLEEVVRALDLTGGIEPYTRCMECNGELESAKRSKVVRAVPLQVFLVYRDFKRCKHCKRVYWRGSHLKRLDRIVERARSVGERPGYLDLAESGELAQRAADAWRHLEDCDLCARYCRINRLETIKGAVCRTGERAIVHSQGPHHGEERPLRGWKGSGTIFFSWCNLRCVHCQNWDISQKGLGRELDVEQLAELMLDLQVQGCHNINFVSPSHVVAQIIAAVEVAVRKGLRLPLVYNTGGYDSLEALRLLDGIIDIYMPDMQYGDAEKAHRFSHVRNYVKFNREAVREMHRQVGDLALDENGIALRGLLVRHLVLPENISGTDRVLEFIAREISSGTYVNLMDQYRPCYRADENPPLDRPITSREFSQAIAWADNLGLRRLDRRLSPAP